MVQESINGTYAREADVSKTNQQNFAQVVLQLMAQAKRLHFLEEELVKHQQYARGLEMDLEHVVDQLQRLQR